MFISNFHTIEEALKAGKEVKQIIVAKPYGPRIQKIVELAKAKGVRVSESALKDMALLVQGQDIRGAIAEIVSNNEDDFDSILERLKEEIESGKKPVVLVLDGVTDPHNLGAMIRSADKFNVSMVVIPKRRSAGEGPIVHSSSAGATQYIPLVSVQNTSRALEQLKEAGFWIWAADMNGQESHKTDSDCPIALVMGAEGKGVGQLVTKNSDIIVSIPTGGHIDSLNVSNACAILLYEIWRQRNFKFS